MAQMSLLKERRFLPFFTVAFLTTFNDNVFKQALLVYILTQNLSVFGLSSDVLIPMSTVIIILPYVLLSATAGQALDKHPKSNGIKWVKFAEIAVMGLGIAGLLTGNMMILLATLFLTGLQSTFFGPAKYSLLPEVLDDTELVGGNALIEMGTFLSVLSGTIFGGVLMGSMGLEQGRIAVSVAIITIAIIGAVVSVFIPPSRATDPDLKINLNPVTPNVEIWRETRKNRTAFLGVMGLSWFWFVGTGMLAVVPVYADVLMNKYANGPTFFMALFSVGIGVGSLACERLSKSQLELGLVPLGSFGMMVFMFDLFLAGTPEFAPPGTFVTIPMFLSDWRGWRIAIDLTGVAFFGGLFTVPLYTLVQQATPEELRSRVIAGSNIISSVFMLVAGGMTAVMFAQKIGSPWVFLVLAVMHLIVSLYIYHLLPAFMWRFMVWVLTRVVYRFDFTGEEHIPKEGPAVITCNHPSFIDFMFVAAACRRPPRFIMFHTFFDMPVLGWLFREVDTIPIAPRKEDPELLDAAYDEIAEALENDELIVIFPEGLVSFDGKLNTFKSGVEQIIERTPVPVIPMALDGMWGSFFSRKHGKAMSKPFSRFRARVNLKIGAPISPEGLTSKQLGEITAEMGGWEPPGDEDNVPESEQ